MPRQPSYHAKWTFSYNAGWVDFNRSHRTKLSFGWLTGDKNHDDICLGTGALVKELNIDGR
jgi:hypothetical protein